jgi:ligand-binding SRPBCC domain-containing protein
MPKFDLRTNVDASMNDVWTRFDKTLLEKLSPPFPLIRIEQFDGCEINDHVVLEMNFILFKTIWSSIITDNKITDSENHFTDEGVKMPFGLRYWKHKHIIKKVTDTTCAIVDSIHFYTKYPLLDYLLFPLFYGMILFRIPIYKKTLINKK